MVLTCPSCDLCIKTRRLVESFLIDENAVSSRRRVTKLSEEQLVRKRAADRASQRASRERTRERIGRLENRIRELEGDPAENSEVRALEARNSELEEELERLRAVHEKANQGIIRTNQNPKINTSSTETVPGPLANTSTALLRAAAFRTGKARTRYTPSSFSHGNSLSYVLIACLEVPLTPIQILKYLLNIKSQLFKPIPHKEGAVSNPI